VLQDHVPQAISGYAGRPTTAALGVSMGPPKQRAWTHSHEVRLAARLVADIDGSALSALRFSDLAIRKPLQSPHEHVVFSRQAVGLSEDLGPFRPEALFFPFFGRQGSMLPVLRRGLFFLMLAGPFATGSAVQFANGVRARRHSVDRYDEAFHFPCFLLRRGKGVGMRGDFGLWRKVPIIAHQPLYPSSKHLLDF
jgi:hypothetical protein